MRSTKQLSVTVPNEMAAEVAAKVASGEYASESEVIRDGLRALQARDKAIEQWLRQDVVATYDAMKANPARGCSPSEVRAALAAEHATEPMRRLVLRADSKLTYGQVREILSRSQQVGFPGMSLMVGERHKVDAADAGGDEATGAGGEKSAAAGADGHEG